MIPGSPCLALGPPPLYDPDARDRAGPPAAQRAGLGLGAVAAPGGDRPVPAGGAVAVGHGATVVERRGAGRLAAGGPSARPRAGARGGAGAEAGLPSPGPTVCVGDRRPDRPGDAGPALALAARGTGVPPAASPG